MRSLLPILAVAFVAWLAVEPARTGGFVYDDQHYVVRNPAVSGAASPWATPLGAPEQALWRPLTVASFRWQWPDRARSQSGAGVEAGTRAAADAGAAQAGTGTTVPAEPFRALNIALHVLAALALLGLARRLGLGAGGSLAAALLFATHPVHAEAVAWVSGRSELLAGLLVLLAWRAHLSPRRGAGWASAALVAAAVLAKENALLAPAIFALGDLALSGRVRWSRAAFAGAAALAAFLPRFAVLPAALPGEAPFGSLSLLERLPVALNILAASVRLLVWPEGLRVFHPRDELLGWQPASLLLLAAAGLTAAFLRRRAPLAATALALLPVSLAMVLNLVPIGATFAERFLYLPSVLACLAAGAVLEALGRAERRSGRGLGLSLALALLLLGAAIPASRTAAAVFHDDLSLWARAAALRPDSAHIRYNHGYFLDRTGRHLALAPDLPGAAEELTASLRIDPRHLYAGFAHQTLGNIALRGDGRLAPDFVEAARHYRAAIERMPELWDARINLASLAVGAPGLVSAGEALAALAPLPDLDAERRAAVESLRAQLTERGPAEGGSATGTSSPEGS